MNSGSSSISTLWLAFAPGAIEASMPELGVPQLAAWLRTQGVPLRSFDLNLDFWRGFMESPTARERFREVIASPDVGRRFGIDRHTHLQYLQDLQSPDFRFKPISMLHPRGLSHDNAFALMQLASITLGLEPDDYRLDTVMQHLDEPHPVLDEYFDYWMEQCGDEVPGVVGFSIAVAPQILGSLWLARRLKERFPGVTTVMGGPWVSMAWPYMPSWLSRFAMMDAAVLFEGHTALLKLCQNPKTDTPVAGMLLRRDNGDVAAAPAEEPLGLQELPPADFAGFDLAAYRDRVLPVQSSRNCSWSRCTFCYHRHNSAVAGHQCRSVRTVVDHMEQHIGQYGIREFFIADSCPTTAQIAAIAREILVRDLQIEWYVMPRFTGEWTREVASTVALSGLRHVYMGLESVSEAQRERIDKGSDLATAEHDLANLSAAGMDISLFVIDLPGQSAAELMATYQWVLQRHSMIDNIIAQKFQLGRNTRAFEEPETLGVRPLPGHEQWLNVFGIPYDCDEEIPRQTFKAIDDFFMNAFNALSRGEETLESLERRGVFQPCPPALAAIVS